MPQPLGSDVNRSHRHADQPQNGLGFPTRFVALWFVIPARNLLLTSLVILAQSEAEGEESPYFVRATAASTGLPIPGRTRRSAMPILDRPDFTRAIRNRAAAPTTLPRAQSNGPSEAPERSRRGATTDLPSSTSPIGSPKAPFPIHSTVTNAVLPGAPSKHRLGAG